ncbi:hypothetical protein NL676_013662 [Syzygium grande]|nr:hypothetical protein NL676_013662 [Syzygium grande]
MVEGSWRHSYHPLSCATSLIICWCRVFLLPKEDRARPLRTSVHAVRDVVNYIVLRGIADDDFVTQLRPLYDDGDNRLSVFVFSSSFR